ncbi:mariner Mos1 transposase [Nephila pilipes]|uniref:Mariner Mos1 transposase n=1 Tax=Nephila pilipes TaxID=299642 RepID=A0A8X6UU93_NEPPI|nr:mariner Mos1 transposase [Nephila pilipes]
MFENGCKHIDDAERKGRPSTTSNSKIATRVNECFLAYKLITTYETSNEKDISHRSDHKIIADYFQFHKIGAQWGPRLLMVEHKGKHFETSFAFLQRYQQKGNEFWVTFVTGDETFNLHFSPEKK